MLSLETLEARFVRLSQSPRLRAEIISELHYGEAHFPLWAFFWGDPSQRAVYVMAGVHGDEPVGVEAALRLLESLAEGERPLKTHRLLILPCLNPSGLADGTRANRAGQDINRQFHGDGTQESAAVRRFLDLRDADALIDLHTDPNAQGYYFFELKRDGVEPLAAPILNALTEAGYPLEEEPFFAGYVGHHGLFAPTTAGLEEFHRRAPGLSLAEWGLASGIPRTYSFETPRREDYERRTAMHLTALRALFAALEA